MSSAHPFFFFSSRRRHTRFDCDWSSDVCSSDLRDAGERRGAGRKRSGERLAFAGLHLRDLALEHDAAAEKLDVERTHAEKAACALARDGENARHQLFGQALAVKTAPELRDAVADLLVGQRAELARGGVDALEELGMAGAAAERLLADEPGDARRRAIEPAVPQILALRIKPERDSRAQRGAARHRSVAAGAGAA